MSTQIAQAPHRFSMRSVALAVVGAALAVAAGFGISAAVLDDPTAAPATVLDKDPAPAGSDLSNGTDRETRELMHRH